MTEFEKVRPYYDYEVNSVIRELIDDPQFVSIVGSLYPHRGEKEQILQMMAGITTINDFQILIVLPLLEKIIQKSTGGLTYSTMEQFQTEGHYLFISNHRDIILDPAFLNVIMHKNNFKKTEVAIGDNLLIYNWIKKLMRINRAFIVKRGVGFREKLKASQTLSAYIRETLTMGKRSVWIAQREGRTKDGNDQTQPALLKMLSMSNNSSSVVRGFEALNIVPMAISYEIEPCGISKVEELLKRKQDPNFIKTQKDDLKSMANGLMQPKGRVHFSFGNPLNVKIDKFATGKNKNGIIQSIARYIDQRIYANYQLWPNNYIAADLLTQGTTRQTKYTNAEKQKFVTRMENEIASIAFPKEKATEMYLRMYANPVFNFEKYFGNE